MDVQKLKQNGVLAFLGMVGLAGAMRFVPYVDIPLVWMKTFFHEISHGLVSILTGGKILNIELNFNGSGSCTSQGGFDVLIAFAGYAGAILWGALIYLIADSVSKKTADRLAAAILFMFGVTAVLWARDPATWIILGIISVPFWVVFKTRDLLIEKYFMQFAGIYILLDAIQGPRHLLGMTVKTDAKTLQKLLILPEFVWITIWTLMGVATLAYLLYRHVKYDQKRLKKRS